MVLMHGGPLVQAINLKKINAIKNQINQRSALPATYLSQAEFSFVKK